MVSLFDDGKGGSESRPFIVYKIQSEDEDSSAQSENLGDCVKILIFAS